MNNKTVCLIKKIGWNKKILHKQTYQTISKLYKKITIQNYSIIMKMKPKGNF